MDTSLIPVCVGACLCPGTPHADGDFVYLRRNLGLAEGIGLNRALTDGKAKYDGWPDFATRLTGVVVESYLIYGVAKWNLRDAKGAIPITTETITRHLLSDITRSRAAANEADALYFARYIAPLLGLASTSSAPTSSNGQTPATRNGSPKRPKRSKPSSITTSETVATEATT